VVRAGKSAGVLAVARLGIVTLIWPETGALAWAEAVARQQIVLLGGVMALAMTTQILAENVAGAPS
jgi:hypothetical protein